MSTYVSTVGLVRSKSLTYIASCMLDVFSVILDGVPYFYIFKFHWMSSLLTELAADVITK